MFHAFSVILPYISECLVEQILVLDLVLNVNHLAQGLLDFTFPSLSVLPAGKPNQLRILVIPIIDSGFIRSPVLPNAMS